MIYPVIFDHDVRAVVGIAPHTVAGKIRERHQWSRRTDGRGRQDDDGGQFVGPPEDRRLISAPIWIGKEIANPRYPAYKDFLTGFITPNISWLAFFIVAGEAFVCFSLMTGFLTRLGGFVGFVMAINLFIGLTAVPNEWDWTYLMLIVANALFIVVGGRFIGLDAMLYARLKRIADGGSPIAGILARIVS